MSGFILVLAVAVPAALASPLGGLIAVWRRPTTLLLSIAVGYAGGVLLSTFAFEMLPKALEYASLWPTVMGFAAGFGLVLGLDLFINRGRVAGEKASQNARTRRFHLRHPPRGDETTVLAAGTSAEELIEGMSIGVGAAIDPSIGLIVALAVTIDNVSEAMSIGELMRKKGKDKEPPTWRILGWTSLIGTSLLGSAVISWFVLRAIPPWALGTILAAGAGGMFYLTVTDLLPESERHHYQQSAAIAAGAGFLTILILSELAREWQ